MLNSFVKNKIGLTYEEVIENCTLDGGDSNDVYIEWVSNEVVFVICTIKDVDLLNVDENFYEHLLEENSNNERPTGPLYWGINKEQRAVFCSGFVNFQDPLTWEEDLYSLVCTLIGYSFLSREENLSKDRDLSDSLLLVNKV
ncbi:MAG: hypothetical protein LBF34_00160 [Puniceicoccales bacterium]|jgi:hypothetical protein|nr:hypothetical protein [Puniceicoccales bacterium]